MLYGLVDLGYGYSKTDGGKALNSVDSGTAGASRWGIRGTESLGSDLKLNFQLESGMDADTGQRVQTAACSVAPPGPACRAPSAS